MLTEKEVGADGKWLQKNYSYTDGMVTGSITRHYTYDEYEFPTGRTASSSTAGTFTSAAYKFNPMNGNLSSRKDVIRNLTENFTYDNLNRLIGYKDATVTYNSFGNILSKSDAGALEYSGYKAQSITPARNLFDVLSKKQDIAYTSFMRPDSIAENGYQATFSYNAENQRVKMQIKKDGNDYLTRYYLGNIYELDNKVGEIKEKLYLGGNYYDAYAVYVKQDGVWQLNYICRDYLGSITHITNDAGSLLAEYSYDAWGRLRNPVNQSVYAPGTEPELMLGRGYTGHEHLAVFGLINMNARLYDPILGRFLSPDPYVQLPDNLQGFNRYTYGMNNPLCYVDENGEFWWFIAAAVIGGALSYFQGKNVWNGADIAAGRNAFSVKNTPLNGVEHPELMQYSTEEAMPMSSDPLLNHEEMTPYEKGNLGVNEAIREFKAEGGTVFSKEVTIELDGVRNRFDFVGELDTKLYLFEVKNGLKAGFRTNQKINLPNFLKHKPSFVPVGKNALKVPHFQDLVPFKQPYTRDYIVIIKHYF